MFLGWRSNDNLVYHVKVFETGLSTCSGRDNEHPFVKASSPRTLCVGYTYDVAPCRIDTGGGLITSIEDKFYLKGLVAGSLATDKIHCESSSYGVFTDVSKFEDWIAANTNV